MTKSNSPSTTSGKGFFINLMPFLLFLLLIVFSNCSTNNRTNENHAQENKSEVSSQKEGKGEHSSSKERAEGHNEKREGKGEHSGKREGRGEHGSKGESKGEHGGKGESRGEHNRDRGEGGESEESGTEYGLDQTYDKVRKGAHLVMSYDAKSNAFMGTVTNTTNKTLEQVRIEIHLSNGKELGPTVPADLAPGAKRAIKLQAESKNFTAWNAHPEIGRNEHSHAGGEGAGGHN
jgi:hypothetical protein